MAFCPNCGKQLADGEVCSCTAAPVTAPEMTAPAAPAPAPEAAPAQESAPAASSVDYAAMANNAKEAASKAGQAAKEATGKAVDYAKKNIKLVGGIAAGVVLLIIVLALVLGGGGSYKAPIDDAVSAINNIKKGGYLKAATNGMPKDYVNLMTDTLNLAGDRLEDLDDDLQDYIEDLEDQYPKWKLSFEYDSNEKLDKSDLKDIAEEFEDIYENYLEDIVDEISDMDSDDIEDAADELDCSEKDIEKLMKSISKFYGSFKKVKVSEGYKVKGRFILKDGKDEVDKTDKVTLYVVKLNGDWVIAKSKDGDTFRFDSSKKHYSDYSFLTSYLNSRFYERAVRNFGFGF